MTPPRHCREVTAERAKKGLSLRALAALAGVDYFRACKILRGRETDPKAFAKLKRAAFKAPTPREEVIA